MPNTYDSRIVCFGEILWDILPAGALPGGAPTNVAYHLYKLGIQPTLITRVGSDKRGKQLLGLINSMNINTDNIQLDHAVATGIVSAVPNELGEMKYDIVSPSAWDYITFDKSMQLKVKDASHFIFGSLITRGTTSRQTLFQLLEVANQKVLDINLRPPYIDRPMVKNLLQKANMAKMNISELELISGWYSSYKDIPDRIKFIQDQFEIPAVIVTMGSQGAIVNMEGQWYSHPGYKVQVADTVGSGDSFLAAFLFELINGKSPGDALAFANALGAFTATKNGAWPSYDVSQIHTFMNSYQK